MFYLMIVGLIFPYRQILIGQDHVYFVNIPI